MIILIFIADGWGAVNGGINSFNYDLVTACAHVKRTDRHTKICCVVPGLTTEQQTEMKNEGIIPITCSKELFQSPEVIQVISETIQTNHEFQRYYPDKCNTFCVGHDIYTGNLSQQLAEKCGGWNIVFHHMDYASYYLLDKPNVSSYEEKVNKQKKILCNADLICAVGPMLLQSAQDISRSVNSNKCIEVFPGLAAFDALSTHPNRFNPIVFGRVEKDNQAIKQIPLAIDAFATAISMDKDTPIINNNPTLSVIGYEADNSDALTKEVRRLQKKAAQIAGCICNVIPCPYISDRTKLGERLRAASVAMMLSFHEGFGLVGYEAIAAGIPLILSKNTGLYMFLKREQLDHLVYPVQITGSSSPEKYSQEDLYTVAKALRNIRQAEGDYKKKALDLRDALLSKKDKYSWEAVANSFVQNVLQQFEAELKSTSTVFYAPDEVTKLSADLKAGVYTDIVFTPSLNKRVFTVKGKSALASLVVCLQKKFEKQYDVSIYNVHNGEDAGSVYLDFLDNCWAAFGKNDDMKGLGFVGFLGKRLKKSILILDNFSEELIPDFANIFDFLNGQPYDFYIFAVFESDTTPQILPYTYSRKGTSGLHGVASKHEPVPTCLTTEQKLIIKVLAFRGKMGYSKRLIDYICNGINTHRTGQDESECLTGFEDSAKIENELKVLGLIEEYSEYSYQNVEEYLSATGALDVDNKSYALGLAILGRFYAKCYYCGWSRYQQLSWGYFSCKCFSSAAAIDHEIKQEIKADYETLLRRIRKKAMDTSDYETYFNALQKFIDEYEKPDDPWLWYALIHCEAIYRPGKDALDKVYHVLETEFPDTEKDKRKGNQLYIQFIRLVAELEAELGMDNSLERLLDRIEALAEDNQSGTIWCQCFLTIINLAADREDFDMADRYLVQFRNATQPDELYSEMIAMAEEIDLKIAKHLAGYKVDLTNILREIRYAFQISRDKLQDYRAQAWTVGLWGECQILLNDGCGEGNLRKAMNMRKSSGEKTKVYRNWLKRISKYPSLQPPTKKLLEQEMTRMGMLAYGGSKVLIGEISKIY